MGRSLSLGPGGRAPSTANALASLFNRGFFEVGKVQHRVKTNGFLQVTKDRLTAA